MVAQNKDRCDSPLVKENSEIDSFTYVDRTCSVGHVQHCKVAVQRYPR